MNFRIHFPFSKFTLNSKEFTFDFEVKRHLTPTTSPHTPTTSLNLLPVPPFHFFDVTDLTKWLVYGSRFNEVVGVMEHLRNEMRSG